MFFQMTTQYTQVKGLYLPEATDITMYFPPDFQNFQRLGRKPTEMKAFDAQMTDEWLEGTIAIRFDDYDVNQGLPDSLFEDPETDTIQD